LPVAASPTQESWKYFQKAFERGTSSLAVRRERGQDGSLAPESSSTTTGLSSAMPVTLRPLDPVKHRPAWLLWRQVQQGQLRLNGDASIRCDVVTVATASLQDDEDDLRDEVLLCGKKDVRAAGRASPRAGSPPDLHIAGFPLAKGSLVAVICFRHASRITTMRSCRLLLNEVPVAGPHGRLPERSS